MSEHHICYLDDDVEDQEFFEIACSQIEEKITLNLATEPEDLINILKVNKENKLIVLLDINLRKGSGFEVLKTIRKDPALKHLPVAMYSTSSHPNSIKISKDLGANRYIVKPTDFSDLKTVIQKVINSDWNNIAAGDFLISNG